MDFGLGLIGTSLLQEQVHEEQEEKEKPHLGLYKGKLQKNYLNL